MKPVIVYVDDEPNNLVIFEASLPDDWEVYTFSNPLEAVDKITDIQPWVIVSDQRMPGMSGVKFLELSSKLSPNSIKLITTGYSDENLVIDSIRTAHVFDYIVKPWDADDLVIRIEKAVNSFSSAREREELTQKVHEHSKALEVKNKELESAMNEITLSKDEERKIRTELECWIPPVVTWATKNKIQFPIHRNLTLMAIDIVGSGELHNKKIGDHTARQKILLEFSMLVVKHGGYVETFEGDAAYANFGLMESNENPSDAALAVANEFRAALKGLQHHYDTTIECGIALHHHQSVKAMIHEYSVTTERGIVIQKRFSTESSGIDLVHRMEKMTHTLPGSNIVMTPEFMNNLTHPLKSPDLRNIGFHQFKGQPTEVELFLVKSQLASEDEINNITKNKSAA